MIQNSGDTVPRHRHVQTTHTGMLPLIAHHIRRHVGPGILCSVGYFDPLISTRV